jgi:hypothetical protein
MKTTCLRRGRRLLLALFIGSHLVLSGCNDESKTSGTMVEPSEEAKAQLKGRRNLYKSKTDDLKEKKGQKGKPKTPQTS